MQTNSIHQISLQLVCNGSDCTLKQIDQFENEHIHWTFLKVSEKLYPIDGQFKFAKLKRFCGSGRDVVSEKLIMEAYNLIICNVIQKDYCITKIIFRVHEQ